MRLAVFSDIHGNLTAFDAALADYEASGGADIVWYLGDYGAFGARPSECIQRVRTLAEAAKAAVEADPAQRGKFRAIRGNVDRYMVTGEVLKATLPEKADDFATFIETSGKNKANLQWGMERLGWEEYEFLKGLPGECSTVVDGYGTVIGYHGTPGSDEGFLRPTSDDEEAEDALLDREGRLGIGAHIHVQMDRTLRNGWRVINIGSVGMSFDMPGNAQWGLFTFEGGDVQVDLRVVPYDVEAAIADLSAVGYPNIEMAAKRLREGKKD